MLTRFERPGRRPDTPLALAGSFEVTVPLSTDASGISVRDRWLGAYGAGSEEFWMYGISGDCENLHLTAPKEADGCILCRRAKMESRLRSDQAQGDE